MPYTCLEKPTTCIEENYYRVKENKFSLFGDSTRGDDDFGFTPYTNYGK